MLLNLASIIHTPGGIVPFSFSMDFSQSEFGGAYPAQEPVLVTGQVRNEARCSSAKRRNEDHAALRL